MAYVVTEACIRCKYMECVEVCPVSCFAAGDMMLVIDPVRCIDCGFCGPACPAEAIVHDSEPGAAPWAAINRSFASHWPGISRKGTPFSDADDWKGRPGKAALLDPAPPGLDTARP